MKSPIALLLIAFCFSFNHAQERKLQQQEELPGQFEGFGGTTHPDENSAPSADYLQYLESIEFLHNGFGSLGGINRDQTVDTETRPEEEVVVENP